MKLLALCLLLLPAAPAHAELKNDAELGFILTSGNSNTSTLSAKDQSRLDFGKDVLQLNAAFLRSRQNDALSAKSWLVGLRYERELSEHFSIFAAQTAEADRFAGIRQRYNSDVGGKYFFRKLEKDFIWFAELGYRFTRENSTQGVHQNLQKARLYTEAEKFWTESTSTKLWIEYIPNFTLTPGWLLNSEASVSSALNSVFAIKSAYLFRYNNRPPAAAGKTDKALTTSLVAKF